MKIVHAVPGLEEKANGIAVAARMIAADQGARLVEAARLSAADLEGADELWVHSLWTPPVWRACRLAAKFRAAGGRLAMVRMTHGCLDPVRLAYHRFRKLLVSPIERRCFALADRIAVTGPWEEDWCRGWGLQGGFETVDLAKFFRFPSVAAKPPAGALKVLYLGRRHPLKGVATLEAAVADARRSGADVRLTVASAAFGDGRERLFAESDLLCLPTLSENFGLVVAEALERGLGVLVTDGAPAWAPERVGDFGGRLAYLRGYRGAASRERRRLLAEALERIAKGSQREERR